MINKDHTYIECETMEEREELLELLLKKGYEWHGEAWWISAGEIEFEFPFSEYPIIDFTEKDEYRTMFMQGYEKGAEVGQVPYALVKESLKKGRPKHATLW